MFNVSYEGIGYLSVTIPNNTCVAGQLCKLNLVGQCEKCNVGDPFVGFAEVVNERGAAVQIEGFVKVGYSGSTLPSGFVKLSSNGEGGVKLDEAGREYLVMDVDPTNFTAIIKL